MKRDIELLRKIMLAAEAQEHGFCRHIEIEGFSEEQIGYHCYLLVDSGLAIGINGTARGGPSPDWQISYLTSAGHDFVDSARSESAWKEATATVQRTVGTVAVGVLRDILTAAAAQAIRKAMGLPHP